MTTSPSFEYVRMAIAIIRWAPNYNDLVTWWLNEKTNREKWRLTPEQSPGLELKKAFEKRRIELTKERADVHPDPKRVSV